MFPLCSMRTGFLAAITALTLAIPVCGLAYQTPEEVLLNSASPRTGSFSNRQSTLVEELRLSQQHAAALQAQSELATQAAHAAAGASSSSTHSASSAAAVTAQTPNGDAVTLDVDAATLRALVRLARHRSELPSAPVVHAGAPLDEAPVRTRPLTSSGPELWLLGLALMGAMGWTMHRARMKV